MGQQGMAVQHRNIGYTYAYTSFFDMQEDLEDIGHILYYMHFSPYHPKSQHLPKILVLLWTGCHRISQAVNFGPVPAEVSSLAAGDGLLDILGGPVGPGPAVAAASDAPPMVAFEKMLGR